MPYKRNRNKAVSYIITNSKAQELLKKFVITKFMKNVYTFRKLWVPYCIKEMSNTGHCPYKRIRSRNGTSVSIIIGL
jgi:hypothetical protein